jgi:hypothetical protein
VELLFSQLWFGRGTGSLERPDIVSSRQNLSTEFLDIAPTPLIVSSRRDKSYVQQKPYV